MKEELLTFKTFHDHETANDFAEILKEENIKYLIEEDSLAIDANFGNPQINKSYVLKLKPSDFEKASGVYDKYFQILIKDVSNDYYLFSFSDDELNDIIAKPDEWGSFDYQLAKELLKQRGKEISGNEIAFLKTERYKEISKPAQEKKSSVFFIYFICMVSLPVVILTGKSIPIYFFAIALITGWVWGYSKKTLPDGQRIYSYDDYVRKHGRIIVIISAVLFILSIAFIVFVPYQYQRF